jgi:hypothetical protein
MSKPVFGFAGFSLAQSKKPKVNAFGGEEDKKPKPVLEAFKEEEEDGEPIPAANVFLFYFM